MQPVAILIQQLDELICNLVSFSNEETNVDNSTRLDSICEDQLAEVSVLSQKNSTLRPRHLCNFFVRSRFIVCYAPYIMTKLAQHRSQRTIEAFVRQKAHA